MEKHTRKHGDAMANLQFKGTIGELEPGDKAVFYRDGIYVRDAYLVTVKRTTKTRVVVYYPGSRDTEVSFVRSTGLQAGIGYRDLNVTRLLVGQEAVSALADQKREDRRVHILNTLKGLYEFAKDSGSIEAIESKAREVYHELGLDREDSGQKADNRRDVLRIPPVVSAAIWDRLQAMQEELEQAMSEDNTDAD